jgi:CHAD domain-containing protein
MTLYLKSYQQVPAGSLPDNEIELARLAEFGRDIESWRHVAAIATRGWIKCSDGRLYHPVMCEKALAGWLKKLAQRKSSAAGNATRYKKTFDPSFFDQRISEALRLLSDLNPNSRAVTLAARQFSPEQSNQDDVTDVLPMGESRDTREEPVGIHSGSQIEGRLKRDLNVMEDSVSELRTDTSAKGESLPGLFTQARESQKLCQGDFAAWWDLYGKKVGRVVAEKRFREALRKTDIATIMSATQRYIEAEPHRQFRKDPERWLKQERWRDDFVPAHERTSGRPSDARAQSSQWFEGRMHELNGREPVAVSSYDGVTIDGDLA